MQSRLPPRDPWLIARFEKMSRRGRFIELALVVAILAGVYAEQAYVYYQGPMVKARLSEALTLSTTRRIEITEYYALTGTWLGSDVPLQTEETAEAGTGSGGDEVAQYRSSGYIPTKKGAPEKGASERGEMSMPLGSARGTAGSSEGRSHVVGVVDGTVFASGKYPQFGKPVLFTVQPAVLDAADASIIVWLCGTAKAPPGWTALGPAFGTTLTTDYLPSPCRR